MKRLLPRGELSDSQLTTIIATVLLVAGVIVRVQDVGSPRGYTFDEELFGKNAYHYLLPAPDDNDHPPLGKLLQALGILLFDYTPLGRRFVPLCFGLFTLIVVYWLVSALFQNRRAGLFASACVAADGFFIVYSRAGLLDGMLLCLVLWAVLAAVVARSRLGVLSSALLVGLATSIKWSGVMAIVPAVAAVCWLGQVPRSAVALYAAVPLVHLGVWMGGLWLTQEPWDPRSVWSVAVKLFHHHQGRGVEDHGLASPWYSWPVLYQPLVMKESHPGSRHRVSATVGNLVLWAAATVTIVGAPLVALGVRTSARVRRQVPDWIDSALLKNALLLFLGWLALLSPWMLGRGRLTFIYHYLPSYGFALALVGGLLAVVERRHARAVLVFFVLVLLVAIYYAPVWGEFAISTKAMHFRLPFEHWRP